MSQWERVHRSLRASQGGAVQVNLPNRNAKRRLSINELDIAVNTEREARFFQRFTNNFTPPGIWGKNGKE